MAGLTRISPNGDQPTKPTLRPTLVLGLGGTGVDVLRFFKRRLREAWGLGSAEEIPGIIQLLGVDTMPWANLPGQEYLHRHEYAYIGGYNASQVLRHLDNHPTIKAWWNWPPEMVPLGQIHSGARQIRCIGRLSFFRRYRTFWSHLEPKLSRMAAVATIEETENRGYPVIREGGIRHIYIVTSLCGGTGSGIFLDVAHKLRHLFGEQAIITGILGMPSIFLEELDSDLQKRRIQANAYAALKELDAFQSGRDFVVQYPGEDPITVSRPFDRIYLIERRNIAGEVLDTLDDVKQMIAHQIFLETVSHIGSRIWSYDVNISQERHRDGTSMLAYSSFATSALVVPKERMLEYCALKYAERLLDLGLLRELKPEDKNALMAEAQLVITFVRDTIMGRRERQTPATTYPGSDMEESFEEEEELFEEFEDEEEEETWEQEEQQPLATWNEAAYDRLLLDLRDQIHQIVRQYGLRGAHFFVDTLYQSLLAQREQAREDEDNLTRRIEALEINLARVRDPFIVNLLNFWPFDMLFVDNLKRATRRERALLSEQMMRLSRARTRVRTMHDVWDQLIPVAEGLRWEIENRIGDMEAAREKGIIEPLGLFFRLGGRDTWENAYALTSEAVDDRYIVNDFERRNWDRVLRHRLEESLSRLAEDPVIFRVEVETSEQRAFGETVYAKSLKLVSHLPDHEDQPLTWFDIRDRLLRHSRYEVVDVSIQDEEFHFARILATNRALLQERVKQLFARCHPFWRYDLDRGGLDEQDLEHTILVGVDDAVRHMKLYDDLLRDYSEYERVSTGDPLRIEACKISHGLPIMYVENIEVLYRHYREFVTRGPVHLRMDWQDLPEIVLAEAVARPADGPHEPQRPGLA
ncbi:MAG TPA: hypothetical protein G4O02_02110 [Caldilineae bacterium]|nr:hypothetical protein [Caldilineae bacterium]